MDSGVRTLFFSQHSVPGGGHREALHSMLRRTCEANRLSVATVVSEYRIPLTGPKEPRRHQLSKSRHLLDLGGDLARAVQESLMAAAPGIECENLTLAALMQSDELGDIPVARHRRWCCECYREDWLQPHGPYDRLLWVVALVHACPIHMLSLQSQCSECGAEELPWLMGNETSGCCPKCHAALARSVPPTQRLDARGLDYRLWVAEQFRQLLEFDEPLPSGAAGNFRVQVSAAADAYFEGRVSRVATAVRRNKSVLSTWMSGKGRPSWQGVCDFSFVFDVPLKDVFFGQLLLARLDGPRVLPADARKQRPRKAPERRDKARMELFLVEVELGMHPALQTMAEVSKALRLDPNDLRRRLPEAYKGLSRHLSELRAQVRSRAHEARLRDRENALETLAHSFHADGMSVTRRGVEAHLARLGLRMQRNDIMSFYRGLQRRLQEILVSVENSGTS